MSKTLEDKVKDLELRVQKLESIFNQTKNPAVSRKLSIAEFLQTKSPKNHVETIIHLAYFLEKNRDRKFFTSKDIDSCYSEARISKPKNITDLIGQATRRGLVMISDNSPESQKSWALTMSGLKFVESHENKEGRK